MIILHFHLDILLISGGKICVTKPYNGAWDVLANSFETVGHIDLRLREIVHISVFCIISFFWLLPLDGLKFFFVPCLFHDSENDLFAWYLLWVSFLLVSLAACLYGKHYSLTDKKVRKGQYAAAWSLWFSFNIWWRRWLISYNLAPPT